MKRTPQGERTPTRASSATAEVGGRESRASLAVLAFAAFAALALLAGCGGGQDGGGPSEGGSGGSEEQAAKLGTPALGSADAPVVLTEYSDYQ